MSGDDGDNGDADPVAPDRRLTFAKDQRIVRGEDFSRLIRGGTVAADGVLVVFVQRLRGGNVDRRMGVTIPRRTGNAVVRNRWKRWIREAFRVHQHDLPPGLDIVVRPKKGATGDWPSIQKSLPRLIAKASRRLESSGVATDR